MELSYSHSQSQRLLRQRNMLALAVALASTAAGQTMFALVGAWFDGIWSSIQQTFGGGA